MTIYRSYKELIASGRVKNRMTLKRWIDAGHFPKPVRLGPNTVAWDDDELAAYDARIRAERDAGKSAA